MYKLYKVIKFRGKEESRILVDTFKSLVDAREFQAYLIVNGKTMIDNGRIVEWKVVEEK
jgi:hypothetical protein